MTSNDLFPYTSINNFQKASPILSLSPTHVIWKGNRMLNFASHDYLGLSQHAELKKSAIRALLHYGTGVCFADVRQSYVEYQKQLEEKYAELLGMQEVHFFSCRWTALALLLASMQSDCGTCFVDVNADPLFHHVAKSWKRAVPYDAEDLNNLAVFLAKESQQSGPKLIIIESILSLNGKVCDLDPLLHLAKKHGALVLVDDSNAFSVMGNNGTGLGTNRGAIDFLLCSLDRGAGIAGASLASHLKMEIFLKTIPIEMREWSLSYSCLGAIDTALDAISSMEGERKQLEQRCHWLRMQFKRLEIPSDNASHFFCFSFDDKMSAGELWQRLANHEILAELLETTTFGSAKYTVRLVINAAHTPEDLNCLLSCFEKFKLYTP